MCVTEKGQKSIIQFTRYLLVGGFNTLFGYGTFALLTWLFRGLGSFGYMLAFVASNLIAISVAFLAYKWFVFRTRGNYLVEWLRCFAVYGGSALIGLAALPILVTISRRIVHKPEQAPYLAGAILTLAAVILSFLGHRNFSFRPKRAGSA